MSVNKNVMKMNDEQTMQFIDYYEKEGSSMEQKITILQK